MPAKLSEREKAIRGTQQRCRTAQVRSPKAVRRDIRDVKRVISDMMFNLKIARESVHSEGALIEVLVTSSNGNFEKTRRLNPSFKIQREALTALKSLNRQLLLLDEEKRVAEAKLQKAEESSEFSI